VRGRARGEEPLTAWAVTREKMFGGAGRVKAGEGAGQVKARVKGEPTGVSYFHTF
jgi:hypothetical protein